MTIGTENPKMNKTNALTLSNFQPRRGNAIYNEESGYKAMLGGRAVIRVVVIQRKAHLGSAASSFGEDYTTDLDL